MRILLKAGLIDVASGKWAVLTSDAIDDPETGIRNRGKNPRIPVSEPNRFPAVATGPMQFRLSCTE